jgi:hypothetical protein
MVSHLRGLPFSFNPNQHFDTIGGHDGPNIDSNRRPCWPEVGRGDILEYCTEI